MSKFEDVLNINVNEKTEKKNGLTYLSWAWAWAEFKKIYPDATYEVKRFGDFPYIHDETGYMVFTSVTAEALTYEMWLPVLDNRGKAIVKPTVFEINKTIMRCLTKNLAMFGLGLYIYAGEDLPEAETQKPATAPQTGKAEGKHTEPQKPASKPQEPQDELTAAMMTKVTIRGTQYTLGRLPQAALEWLAEKAKTDDLREAAQLILRTKFYTNLREAEEAPPLDDEE